MRRWAIQKFPFRPEPFWRSQNGIIVSVCFYFPDKDEKPLNKSGNSEAKWEGNYDLTWQLSSSAKWFDNRTTESDLQYTQVVAILRLVDAPHVFFGQTSDSELGLARHVEYHRIRIRSFWEYVYFINYCISMYIYRYWYKWTKWLIKSREGFGLWTSCCFTCCFSLPGR